MPRGISKERAKMRMIAVGNFIKTIRETGKAPSMHHCLVLAGYANPHNGGLCRKMTEALRSLGVYGLHKDGSAFLYKQNWDSVALMHDIEEKMKTMELPAKTKKTVEIPKLKDPNRKFSPSEMAKACDIDLHDDPIETEIKRLDKEVEDLLKQADETQKKIDQLNRLHDAKNAVESFCFMRGITLDELETIIKQMKVYDNK